MQVVWNGSAAECGQLMEIIARNCTCQYDASGVRTTACASHVALIKQQRFVDGLVFARRIASRLIAEEWATGQPARRARAKQQV